MTKKKTPPAEPATKPAKAESKPAIRATKPVKSETTGPTVTKPKREPLPEVDVETSSCPSCGSTERTGYHSTKCRAISGQLANGRKYTLVIWKRTACRGCGKNRIDRFYLNRKPRKADGELLGQVG